MKTIEFLKSKEIPLQRKVFAVLASLVITGLFVADQVYFHGRIEITLLIVEAVALFLLVVGIMTLVGMAVMRALFRISAGLSLVIFLGQSYCASSMRTAESDSALHFLLIFGAGCLIVDFVRTLYRGLMKTFNNFEDFDSRWKKAGMLLLVAVFAGVFLWNIYLVIRPIGLDLLICKYQ